jgi:hypothetical protein
MNIIIDRLFYGGILVDFFIITIETMIWRNAHCCTTITCSLLIGLILGSTFGLTTFLDNQYQGALSQYRETRVYGNMTIRRNSDTDDRQFGSQKYRLSDPRCYPKFTFLNFYHPIVFVKIPDNSGNHTYRDVMHYCAGVPIVLEEMKYCVKCKRCDQEPLISQWNSQCDYLKSQSEQEYTKCIDELQMNCRKDSFVGETVPITTHPLHICSQIWIQEEVDFLPEYEFSSFTNTIHALVITSTVLVGVYLLIRFVNELSDISIKARNEYYSRKICDVCWQCTELDTQVSTRNNDCWGYICCCYGIRSYCEWLIDYTPWSCCSNKNSDIIKSSTSIVIPKEELQSSSINSQTV